MGYLAEFISNLKNATAGDDLPSPVGYWREETKIQWLQNAPEAAAERRALMIDAVRQRLDGLSGKLGHAAIERALCGMAKVSRERFVCPLIDDLAYLPMSLDIGLEQVISHPELVAVLAAAVDPQGGSVLDVGTGSGYQAAVLAEMAAHVTTVEILAPLARLAAQRLSRLGYTNVDSVTGDAVAVGVCRPGAYDAIVVAAGSSKVPDEFRLALKIGGRLVMPIGPDRDSEYLVMVERLSGIAWRDTVLRPARFVPLTGRGHRISAQAN